MVDGEFDSKVKECKSVLEKCLESAPVFFDYFDDSKLENYMIENGYEKFLKKDASGRFNINGVCDFVLSEFARAKKVFKGKKGDFVIESHYAANSSKFFEACYL